MRSVLSDAAMATVPALVLAAMSLVIGHWSIPIAWLHQEAGLAGHVRFSKKHGFTWYAIEDPVRYVALSKATVDVLRDRVASPSRPGRHRQP